MRDALMNDPEHWRSRAEEARAIAGDLRDSQAGDAGNREGSRSAGGACQAESPLTGLPHSYRSLRVEKIGTVRAAPSRASAAIGPVRSVQVAGGEGRGSIDLLW
jgi:hypothetical protein